MIDLLAMSAAIDRAIDVLELHGHIIHAEQLRVHGPELLRLARSGQELRTAHTDELEQLRIEVAELRERTRVREPDAPTPPVGPATERNQRHG